MKILIVSDTHRDERNLADVLDLEAPNMLIHLGDSEGGEHRIEAMANCDCVMVQGNNDFFSYLPDERELRIGKYRVLLTHGHIYSVTLGVEQLRAEARARDFQIAMFGHTHRPYYENKEGLILLNPGSISYPRQEGRVPSYAVMHMDERTAGIEVEIKYVEQEGN